MGCEDGFTPQGLQAAGAGGRFVISGPVAVVILADSEEPLEIVTCSVEAKSRKQAR